MSDAHPTELNVRMQDGTTVQLHRDEADRLIAGAAAAATAPGPVKQAVAAQAPRVAPGAVLAGFGPWPSWDANRRQGTLTLPDDDSGLFEPERLFVLREQYLFMIEQGKDGHVSIGPIDRAWWTGTENVVQARQRSGKH